MRQKHIYILYGEPESQTGGAPDRGIHEWEVKVEGSGGHRPAPARAAPPVTTRFGVMRLDVIILGVKPLDSGAGCIWVNSASSLDSLKGNKIRLIKGQPLRNEGRVEMPKTSVSRTAPKESIPVDSHNAFDFTAERNQFTVCYINIFNHVHNNGTQ